MDNQEDKSAQELADQVRELFKAYLKEKSEDIPMTNLGILNVKNVRAEDKR